MIGQERMAPASQNGYMTNLTTETFIERAREAHGDFYDYSAVNYVRLSLPVIISCPKHGQFEKWPTIHLRGSGCLQCEIEKAATANTAPVLRDVLE